MSALARAVEMTPTTASRLLETLRGRGFVDYDGATGLFSVGLRAFTVGSSVLQNRKLDRVALPAMRMLADKTGLPVNLAVRDGRTAIYIEQIEAPGVVRLSIQPGVQMPLHATAVGKVLASWLWAEALDDALFAAPLHSFTQHTMTSSEDLSNDLVRVRERGWATDDQEYQAGLFCLAAPVFDRNSNVVAAVSVSTLASLIDADNLTDLARKLVECAGEIGAKLGWIARTRDDMSAVANDFSD
ncbi:IclR family transcriptional regulator [Agrobacterium tumefaciens]|uniref:IclR family transcriptional regulator n=1 Tax=Agrobacterium tumefaciens TaxID=358 RepID=UPI001E643134|nr:IclR family transcriptional regulator [Agrobacterium tumefaciens]